MFQRLKRVFGFASDTDEEDEDLITGNEDCSSEPDSLSSDSKPSDSKSPLEPSYEERPSEDDVATTTPDYSPTELSANCSVEVVQTEETTAVPEERGVCSSYDTSVKPATSSDDSSSINEEDKGDCELSETETITGSETPPVEERPDTVLLNPILKEIKNRGEECGENERTVSNTDDDPKPDSTSSSGSYDILNEIRRLSRQSEPRYMRECLSSVVAQLRLYQSLETELRTILEGHVSSEQSQEEEQPTTEEVTARTQTEFRHSGQLEEDLCQLELVPLKEENERLSHSLSEVNATLVETQEALAQAKTELTEAKTALNEVRDALTKAKETIKEREKSISDLQQSLDETRAQVEALQPELKSLRQRNVELDEIRKKRDVMVAEANAKAHRTKVDTDKTLSEMEAELATLKLRLTELEGTEQQLATTKEEKEKLAGEKEYLTESLTQASKEAESYKAEIEALKSKVSEIEGKYNAAMEGIIEQSGPEVTLPTKRKRGRPRKSEITTGFHANPDMHHSANQSPQSADLPHTGSNIAAEPHIKGYVDPDTVLTPDKNPPVREEATAASKRKVKPDVSTIDELLNGADWMESPTPPKKVQKKPKRQEEEDDFGYKAPPPRHPDSDAQMSLW